MEYVKEEVEKLGIAEFEQKNRSLSIALFDGKELTEVDRDMLEYIMSSGTYGSIQNKVINRLNGNSGSKLKYLVRRIFGPGRKDRDREHFEKTYAIFFKHKVLLPLLPFYRFICAFTKSPSRIKNETDVLRNA